MKWLITFLFLFTLVNAEEITTSNLITNGNFETGNANGWTTSGDVQVLNDCCELNGVTSTKDLEFGDTGSIQQDFNLSSNTITQNMLDNGITLDSSIDAQYGECGVAGCWGVEAGGFGTWQEAPLAAQQSWGGIDLPISNMSTLVGFEILLMAFAEQQRISETDVSKRMYPGGSFDPAGLSKGDGFESLKRKEIANGRLAMVAFLGILAQNQAYPDGLGPVQALLNHVADPWHVNAASNSLAVPWI